MSCSKLPLASNKPTAAVPARGRRARRQSELEEFAKKLKDKTILNDKVILGSVLSSGSYGYVVRGKDVVGVNEYAVKVAPLSDVSLKHEIEVLKKIEGGLWTPNTKGTGVIAESHRFLALSLEGMSLRTLYKSFTPAEMSIPAVLNVLYECVLGLEFIHGKGVIHRDLHPDNILLSKTKGKGKLVFIDYGLSAIREPNGKFLAAKDVSKMTRVFHTTPAVMRGSPHCEADDLVQLVYLGLRIRGSSVVTDLSLKEFHFLKTALREDPSTEIPDEDQFLLPFALSVYEQRRYDDNKKSVMPKHKDILKAIKTTEGYDACFEF